LKLSLKVWRDAGEYEYVTSSCLTLVVQFQSFRSLQQGPL